MSCNPSIGGIGKGHLVKEVDALGGAMAAATDDAGIQFRILNMSKGPAVRATRAQADRVLYRSAIRTRLENQPNLSLFQQPVDDLLLEGSRVVGAVTQSGILFRGRAVVLTAGTFLNGLIHVGLQHYPAGRAGDPPAVSLAARLRELSLPQGRLKTGTPPRIDGRTIDFSVLEEQPGDRRSRAGVFIPRASGAASGPASVLGHAHQRADSCGDSRESRPVAHVLRRHQGRWSAVLPVDRGQDSSFREQGEPPDISRARGSDDPRGLSERDLDLASLRRPDRNRPLDARTGTGAHPPPRLRDRIRLLRSPRAHSLAGEQADRGAVFRRADQRNDRVRRSRRAGIACGHQRRASRPAARALVPRARAGVSRCARR